MIPIPTHKAKYAHQSPFIEFSQGVNENNLAIRDLMCDQALDVQYCEVDIRLWT